MTTPSGSFTSRIRTIFFTLDVNKDGVLSKEDFIIGLKKRYKDLQGEWKPQFVEATAERLWRSLGTGRTLCFEELLERHVKALNDADYRQEFQESLNAFSRLAFDVMDANSNGILSKGEFIHFYTTLKGDLSQADNVAGKAFDAIDKSNECGVTFDEFAAWQRDYYFTDIPDEPEGLWGWLIPDHQWDAYRSAVVRSGGHPCTCWPCSSRWMKYKLIQLRSILL